MDESVRETLQDLRTAYGYAKANRLDNIETVMANAIDAIEFQQRQIDALRKQTKEPADGQ